MPPLEDKKPYPKKDLYYPKTKNNKLKKTKKYLINGSLYSTKIYKLLTKLPSITNNT